MDLAPNSRLRGHDAQRFELLEGARTRLQERAVQLDPGRLGVHVFQARTAQEGAEGVARDRAFIRRRDGVFVNAQKNLGKARTTEEHRELMRN